MWRMVSKILSARISMKRNVIQEYDEFLQGSSDRRALISYLVDPLLLPAKRRNRTIFSNHGIAQQIPQVLNEIGYVVDIVQWDDINWTPTKYYDLFIGHGGINFDRISNNLSGNTVRIYFSTGINWQEFNIREAKRIYELAMRRGYLLNPDRVINTSEEDAYRSADGIICLGNSGAVQTYKKYPLVFGINNAAYALSWSGLKDKDYHEGRKHFLFFSGSGNIHKGLDLLLEAFTETEYHLHICQDIDPKFAKVYHRELTESPNIHFHGFIEMRSPQFLELVSQCNWIVSATCAEGQPGSIIECMAYGMIPILPESANIDLDEFGISMIDCSVESIRSIVFTAANMDAEECKQKSILVSDVVRKNYSVEKFNENLKSAIQQIIDRHQKNLLV
jgi:hypothetical protein